MSNIVAFKQANLPSVQSLSTALRALSNDVGPSGVVLLKMDKTGSWVFGADQTEVQDGSKWAINPFSFCHGFIAWGDGEVLGEKMVPVSEPLPAMDAAPPGAKRGWEVQVGLSLKCLNGEDEGMECRYAATSVGGKKAVQTLALAIAAQVEKDPAKPVPVCMLEKDHYTHKSYGKIYTPEFVLVEWIGMDGGKEEPVAEPAAAVEAAPAAAPAADEPAPRRRRRAV